MILFDEEDGLDDTPMFKQRADEMEASAKRLKDRCAALLAGAKKYRDGITTMLDATNAFTAALADFGGGSDEESLHLGSAVMSQFIKVFRELAGFYDFLRTQLDLGMIERVQKDWMEGVLAAARDERRKYDRKASDYESARVRHQSLKKLTKREVLEKSHADLATARCGEEEARFELARKLTEVELSKRYSFLELVVGAVHAHLMFFRNGTDLLGRLESPINDALQIGEHLRAEKVLRERGLEDMIQGRKEAADRREALIAREVAALEPSPGPGAPGAGASLDGGAAGNGGPGPASGGSVVLSAGPGGPVQMSSANAELSADIERLIRTTRSTSGQQVSIIKQGYLCKRSQGKGRSDFKRRFFVLDSNGMMYYYSHKADSLMQLSRSVRPKNTLPLLTSTVKMDADDPAVRCAFRVVSPEGTYTLQAETEFERADWIAALQAVINCLLNGAIDMDALPRVPVRPTHSRTSSQADVVADFAVHAAASASGGAVAAHAGGRAGGGGGGGGTSSGGFPLTPASSQPGTPLAGTLPGIPSGDGSGSEGDGGHGVAGGGDALSHPRAPSRLGAASRVSGGTGAHGAADGGGSSGASSSSGPLERLRQVAGNRRCADCGAQDPDWASLNLGVLLCIECSGVHRQLGVQVSKVRSCTLDVKVWEPAVIAVFQAVGNDASNKVWEAGMPASGAAAATAAGGAAAGGGGGTEAAAARAADSWVWCDDDSGGEDEEGRAGGGARGPRGSASGRRQVMVDGDSLAAAAAAASSAAAAAAAPPKPAPTAPLSDKARFIQDKYVARAFVTPLPREQAASRLWDAVAGRDVRAALAALAAGADVAAAYRTPRAQRLVSDAAGRAAALDRGGSGSGGGASSHGTSSSGGRASGDGSGSGGIVAAAAAAWGRGGGGGGSTAEAHGVCGTVTVLHLAATLGDVALLEFLLQNGAACQHTDAHGRTALHYAVLFDASECAKVLMRRTSGSGGDLQRLRDARGRTPMDMAMAKGRVTDEELFILLSS